jgi:exodeoxyribonuclease VII large subunit
MSAARSKANAPKETAGQLSLEARFAAVAEVLPASPPDAALLPVPAADGAAPPGPIVVGARPLVVEIPADARGPAERPARSEPRGQEARVQEPRVLNVGELVRAARTMLEARFSDVRVEGEISGCKRSGPGHIYFTLKDSDAQVDCVMFARDAGRLKFRVEDGLKVRCRGRLTIYEGRGKFQLSVTEIEPTGAGALALAFEQLKQKLQAEGLFASARKRPLPFLPRRLGVVTSPTGAVIRDIVRVAHRRFPLPILLAPTPVQGDGAAAQIAAALALVARAPEIDVVILARGGGSLEDLWAFNDEGLARAIAACPVPVISAVGHETDFTIADFVADLRAPTPSAAAEIAVPVHADLRAELQVLGRRLGRAVDGEIRTLRLRLERARRAVGDPRRLLDERRQELDDLAGRGLEALRGGVRRRRNDLRAAEARLFCAHPQRRIADQRAALTALERRLTAAVAARLQPRRRAVDGLRGKLDALSPLKVLERGFSLTRGPDGTLVTDAADVAPGTLVTVTLRQGQLEARVEGAPPEGAEGKRR